MDVRSYALNFVLNLISLGGLSACFCYSINITAFFYFCFCKKSEHLHRRCNSLSFSLL